MQWALDCTGSYADLNDSLGWDEFGSVGGLVGGTIGYNYQIGQVVIGADSTFEAASERGTPSYPFGVYQSAKQESMMTERLRFGYAMDRTLLYVTGGYAGGGVNQSLWDVPNGLSSSQDNWRNGYSVGGDVEYAFNNHISVKADHLYMHLASQWIYVGPDSAKSNMNTSLVRVGVNFRF